MTSQSPGALQTDQTSSLSSFSTLPQDHMMEPHQIWPTGGHAAPPGPQFMPQIDLGNNAGGGNGPQQMPHHLMHQQQHLGMAPMPQQHLGSMIHSNSQPQQTNCASLNMMLHGGGHGINPPNSNSAASMGPPGGYLYLPQQQGQPRMDGPRPSPNSTPPGMGIVPTPLPSVSPPNSAGGGNIDQMTAMATMMFSMGPQGRVGLPQQLMGAEHKPATSLEEQILYKQHAAAVAVAAYHNGGGLEERFPVTPSNVHLAAAQIAAASGQFPQQFIGGPPGLGMMPPHGSPIPPNHQYQPPMPHRPRPEGGQDFMHPDDLQKKESFGGSELLINSWNDTPVSEENCNPVETSTSHNNLNSFMNMPPKDEVGWGGCPPNMNPNGWGGKPAHPGNWQQASTTAATNPPFGKVDSFTSAVVVDHHTQEKLDGRKKAIAETAAMMNKMKLEDKERQEVATKLRAARKAAFEELRESGSAEVDDSRSPAEDDGVAASGVFNNGPQGNFRDFNRRTYAAPPLGNNYNRCGIRPVRGGFPHPPMINDYMGQVIPPGTMFMPPPPGIPPFPGIEGFQSIPPNNTPFPAGFPATYPGMSGFIPAMGHGFPGGIRGFPLNAGRNPYGPPLIQRMPCPRGVVPPMCMMPRGRGMGLRQPGLRFERQEDCNNNMGGGVSSNSNGVSASYDGGLKNSSVVENSIPTLLDGTSNLCGVDVSPALFDKKSDGNILTEHTDETSKNEISEQGNSMGQLALFALESSCQRERLVQQLVDESLECLVCLDKIKHLNKVWDCKQCYIVFHFGCILKWARAKTDQEGLGWRCPGCQFISKDVPKINLCFCRKIRQPLTWNRVDIPHSCGDICLAKRSHTAKNSNICNHPCVSLCHPGPCPPCQAFVKSSCQCGKETTNLKCGFIFRCNTECGKTLNCSAHECTKVCHTEPCQPCDQTIIQTCPCSRAMKRTVVCGTIEPYLCGNICGSLLECGHHTCNSNCHEGRCGPCLFLPALVLNCPCQKQKLSQVRVSCTDPIASCGSVCDRSLTCNHSCQSICHEGDCPPCLGSTEVFCHCGYESRTIRCLDIDDFYGFRCNKRCPRKRSCGKHKCTNLCCIDAEHVCTLVCNRPLSCGLHRCERICHNGKCPTCNSVSFDELACHCGKTVTLPPVACGSMPPQCQYPCIREQVCNLHKNTHTCHSNNIPCPLCTVLIERWCHGKHELRKNVACHIGSISCGRLCGKTLNCGSHTCLRTCHKGDCSVQNDADDAVCRQPCSKRRDACGHSCGSPCHSGQPCPPSNCKEKVTIFCKCKHLSSIASCHQSNSYNQWRSDAILASLSQTKLGAINIHTGSSASKLECSEECALIERNRRVALALQIENPNLKSTGATKINVDPQYSVFLKDTAIKQTSFAIKVYNILIDLVSKTKKIEAIRECKNGRIDYSFEVMGREKRRFVHELAVHFGCVSFGVDPEPNRSVVVSATKGSAWIPSVSLLDTVLIPKSNNLSVFKSIALVPLRHQSSPPPTSSHKYETDVLSETPTSTIDYFEYEE